MPSIDAGKWIDASMVSRRRHALPSHWRTLSFLELVGK